jgi:hypothetical protein
VDPLTLVGDPYAVEMEPVVFLLAGVAVLGLALWAGHRSLMAPRSGTSGTADALGSFIDVFDPARARADRDLASRRHMGAVVPSPDDDERRSRVDLQRGTARIRLR